MGFVTFSKVSVTGMSVVVPTKEINIYDEAEYYENNIKKIDRMKKIVGFYKRRVAEEGITPADLAIGAAKNLLSELNVDKNSFDALVYVAQKMEYPGPLDSYYIHDKLKLSDDCVCTNVSQGCAGWVWGMYLCSQMIQSGAHKKILLLTGDTPSTHIDIADRNQAPIFGDAGSATIIEYDERAKKSYYGIKTISSGYDSIITPAGGERLRYEPDLPQQEPFNAPLVEMFTSKAGYQTNLVKGQLDGGRVFEFTMNLVPLNIKDTMEKAGFVVADIKKCCLHQANKQIVQTVASSAGFNLERVPYGAFEKYGNNTMCSIPTVMCDLKSNGEQFDGYYLCSGFGNGLVSATSILDFSNCYFTTVSDYVPGEDYKTREQWIEYWKNKASGIA